MRSIRKPKRQMPDERSQVEATQQELFGIIKNLSEHYEKAAQLWSHIDKEREQGCYKLAAEQLERACELLLLAAKSRENTIIGLSAFSSDQAGSDNDQ